MEKSKRNKLIIIIVIVALAILIGVLALVNASGNKSEVEGGITVILDSKTVQYSPDAIKDFESISFEKEIKSSSKDDETGTYKGVPLEVILGEIDSDWGNKYENFILTASDGFSTAVSKSDITQGENVVIVYEKDGEALKGADDEGPGPYRIIIVNDPFGNRSIMNLVSIEAE